MTAPTWSRWDHLGKFRLYITPASRKGFPSQPESDACDFRGWRIAWPPISTSQVHHVQRLMLQMEPHRFVNQISAYALGLIGRHAPVSAHHIYEATAGNASPWRGYNPIRLGRVGGPDIVIGEDPIDEPAGEWLPSRLQRFAKRYTAPRRWLGNPVRDDYVRPVRFKLDPPDARMPSFRERPPNEAPSVLGNLWTLSRIAAAWTRTADPVWQRRAEAWQWWRDFRQPAAGYGVVDHGDERDPDRTNPEPRPTITELMRAAGWTGSDKTGWNTRLGEQPILSYLDDPAPGDRGRKMWRIQLGDLIFGEFVEWGFNKQGRWTACPKVGMRQFGTTKRGRTLRPREERGADCKPGTTTVDGVKYPRAEYQKRWASGLRGYLGLSGAVPYYAKPYQRPINPPALGYGEKEYPKNPVRPEVASARQILESHDVDGSISFALARSNAGLPPLPEKPVQTHAERYAEFEARLARYRAGAAIRLVDPRDLGDAVILGIAKDGSVDTKIWRSGISVPRPMKPARIEPDGWIVDDIDRGNPNEASADEPGETGDVFLAKLGGQIEILDQAISPVTAREIARGKGLAPEYAKVEGARMVDRVLDNLCALLHPVAEKTRTPVADNDNDKILQKIAA